MDNSRFASELKQQMRERRMRVIDVARETGLPQPRISQYVTGKRRPTFETVVILANALEWPRQEALEAACRNTAASGTEGDQFPALADIVQMAEPLNPTQKQALGDLLRDVARSWVNSVVDQLHVNTILTCRFPGLLDCLSVRSYRAMFQHPTIAI